MGANGIYGLSGSGLDIESMVKVGMMGKQNEYDKMAQKYTKNEWTKAEYLDVNSQLTTFNVSTLSQYKMSSSMNAKTVTSTDSTISVTANASAGVMTHTVKVDKLSSSAYLIGTKSMTRYDLNTGNAYTASQSESTSVKLADVIFKEKNGNDITFAGNDETVTYNSGDIAFEFTIGNGKDTKTIKYTYEELLDGNKTFSALTSAISNSGLNIKASYDSVQDRFSFFNSEGGADNGITLSFDDSTAGGRAAKAFFESMGLVQSRNGVLENDGATITFDGSGAENKFMGTDGQVTIDGISYKTTDNKVTVSGVTYDVTRATEGSSTSTVAVSQDVESIISKVKSFVEDYNKLLSSLYEKYDEKPNSDYKPLTQSQRDSMKDEQIEKWEKKAKAGLLYHDRTIGKIITEMRSAISSQIEGLDGKYSSAYSIGIGTKGIKGQLTLDEDKLRAALANDSDSVFNVFASMDTNDMTNSKTNGVAQRLGDICTSASKSIKTRAGSSSDITEDSDLNNLLRNLQTRMSNFKRMMNSFEDALYKKYDAMEAALAKLGSQLSFVTGGQ